MCGLFRDRAALCHNSNWSQYNQNPVLPLPQDNVEDLMSIMKYTRDAYQSQYLFDSTVYTIESVSLTKFENNNLYIKKLNCIVLLS